MSKRGAIALILATVLGIVLVVVLLPNYSEWDNGVTGALVLPESPDPIVPGNNSTTGVMTTETPGQHAAPDDRGVNRPTDSTGFNIWNVTTWLELQELADQALSHANPHNYVPEDAGFGYFDGEIRGGFEMPTRFRLNSVSAFTQLLDEQRLCRIQVEARPIHGDDAVAYGTVSINLTIQGVPCYEPQDLVGQRLLSQDLEIYSVQVSSNFGLDAAGNSSWGSVWVYSNDIGNHFDLKIIGYEDGYLLGTFEGYLELSLYQRENVRNQHRRGHLVAVFRAKI